MLSTSVRGQVLWLIGVLVAYWAALRFIPVPGYGVHDWAPGHTLTDYIDRSLIPGHLYVGDRDPEGLFATVPAIGTALFGALTGEWLKDRAADRIRQDNRNGGGRRDLPGTRVDVEFRVSDQQESVDELIRAELRRV